MVTHDFEGVLNLPEGVWKDRSFSDNEIQAIQAALKMAVDGGWRDVEELQDDYDTLLIWDGSDHWVGHRHDGKFYDNSDISVELKGVTHWKTLQPPKESEK